MVFSNTYKEALKGVILDDFDNLDNIGFSTDTSEESASSDALTSEISGLRKSTSEQVKDLILFTYEWDGLLSLTEGNGNTISKVGLFTESSGDNLKISKLLTDAISKTTDIELNVGIMVTVTTTETDLD